MFGDGSCSQLAVHAEWTEEASKEFIRHVMKDLRDASTQSRTVQQLQQCEQSAAAVFGPRVGTKYLIRAAWIKTRADEAGATRALPVVRRILGSYRDLFPCRHTSPHAQTFPF